VVWEIGAGGSWAFGLWPLAFDLWPSNLVCALGLVFWLPGPMRYRAMVLTRDHYER
jgi:hypothetical protein